MRSFCVAARVSSKWIGLSQRWILPRGAPSSPTGTNPISLQAPRRSTRKEPIMLNPKIADHHLMRKACIYIRQSTMAQVRFNQESTERQYNLADQAKSLAWMPQQIPILPENLAPPAE